MKAFEILGGKAYVLELPEGATNPEVHTRSLTFDTPMEVDEWGYDYQSVKLPEGTWQIDGFLSDVNWDESDIEALESAIVAGGWYLDDNPIKVHTWASENADDYKKQFDEAQSRVLSRERTLILRRVDL